MGEKATVACFQTGHRDFQVLKAFGHVDEIEFFHALSDLMLDADHWVVMQRCTEVKQLNTFLATSRGMCASYDFLDTRHRKGPYNVYDGVRNPARFRIIKDAAFCIGDPYCPDRAN